MTNNASLEPGYAQPGYAPASTLLETVSRDTFNALLWALSYPGRIFTLPGGQANRPTTSASCQTIGLALLDLETSFYTPDEMLNRALLRSGSRALPPADAAYHFYPTSALFHADLLVSTLAAIEASSEGTLTAPDQAATLVVACEIGASEIGADFIGRGQRLRIQGPGIQQTTDLLIDRLPATFWQLRNAKIRYPLGIDLFLVDANKVVGLPRTTVVEAE